MKDEKPDSKRIKKRVAAKLDVMCRQSTTDGKLEFQCVSSDISEFGIQIISDRFLEKDKPVLLRIDVPYPQKTAITAIGRIRWCRESKAGDNKAATYAYGINFEELDPKEREALFKYLYYRYYPDGTPRA